MEIGSGFGEPGGTPLLRIPRSIPHTASFGQPTSLCSEGNPLHVSNTGNGALKLITHTGPMTPFLQNVSKLYTAHGINSLSASIEARLASPEKKQQPTLTRLLRKQRNILVTGDCRASPRNSVLKATWSSGCPGMRLSSKMNDVGDLEENYRKHILSVNL